MTQAETSLQIFFELLPDLLCVWNREGSFIEFNAAWTNTLGWTNEELRSHSCFDLLHPEDVEAAVGINNSILDLQKNQTIPLKITNRYRSKDGSYRWLSWRILKSQAQLIYAVAQDVTDQLIREEALPKVQIKLEYSQESLEKIKAELEVRVKERTEELNLANHKLQQQILERQQAEEVIRQSWRKYRSVIDSLKEIVFQIDQEDKWTFLSPAWTEITGFSIAETLNTSYLNYIHPHDRLHKLKLFKIDKKNNFYHQLRYITKDGGYRWVEVYGRLNRDAEGNLLDTSGTINDITERKQAEQQLHNVLTELEFQKFALDQVGLVSITDCNGIMTYVNDKFCQVSQYKREELLGENTYPHPLISSDYHPLEFHQEIWSTINSGKIWRGEMKNKTKDNSSYWIDATVVPFLDPKGIPFQYLTIRFEITQLKQAEAALRSQAEQLSLLSQVALRIRQSLSLEDVLNATVTEVRQLLQADRVVVYRFDSAISGTVVAESVVEGWVSILGKYIQDNAIPEEFQTKYCHGRKRAIADIYKANLAECHLQLLEQFQVKANLIVPIILSGQHSNISSQLEDKTGNSLWGLLVAHQCASPRQWQEDELDLLDQIAVQLAIALQQAGAFEQAQAELVERKQAQEKLWLAQERLQYLLSSSPTVIYTLDSTSYTTTFISDNVFAIVGYHAQEFFTDPLFWINQIHSKERPEILAKLPLIFEQGYCINEYRFRHQNGDYLWLRDELKLVIDHTGKPVEFIGSFIDITERKRAEEEIRNALEKEKELSELKSRFVSMASHEFRTPLTTILSSAELLEHYDWTKEEEIEQLHQIQIEVKHMTELLESVLIIGKADAHKLHFNPTSLDLVKFCISLVNQIQCSIGKQHHIALKITTPEGIELIHPSVIVQSVSHSLLGSTLDSEQGLKFLKTDNYALIAQVDEKLLRHILSNLLTNAIKYSPESSTVKFEISLRTNEVIFEIADQGIGIPLDDQQHLFESFHRATNVGTIPGTGLGLAIVKRCVDVHHGSIMVSSHVEAGTTFRVTIPLDSRN